MSSGSHLEVPARIVADEEPGAPAALTAVKAAPATPTTAPTLSTRKVVLLADNHARLASLLHWLADNYAAELKSTRIPGAVSVAGQDVSHIEVPLAQNGASTIGDPPRLRLIGVEFEALSEANVRPLLADAAVVILVTRDRLENELSFFRIFATTAVLLDHRASVRCLVSERLDYLQPMLTQVSGDAGCAVTPEPLNLSDFKRLWASIAAPFQSINQGPATQRSNSAVTGSSSARPSATHDRVRPNLRVLTQKTTSDTHQSQTQLGETQVANLNESLTALMSIDGALGCFVADYSSGMLLAKAGGGLNLDMAAAGNTDVIKAKMKTMASLGLDDVIEDILITLGTQYHIMRPVAGKQGLFLYMALDKSKSNLALARFKMLDVEKTLTI